MKHTIEQIQTLVGEIDDGLFRDTAWIERSCAHPRAFALRLLRHHAARSPSPTKSSASGYDLYHDLVLCHARSEHPALLWRDSQQRSCALSYAQLHAACSRLRQAWLPRGVRPGQTLCVLDTEGPELAIALLTGLRMGLVVCVLPPRGPDFLRRRIDALAPDHLAAPHRYLPLVRRADAADQGATPDVASRALPEPTIFPAGAISESEDAASHTYEPEAPALRLFSPLHEPLDVPVTVSAETAYQGALRDGLLLLSLRAGTVLAAPEQPFLQVQPALLLAVLLQGATFLHLSARELVREPHQPDAETDVHRIDVLMVSSALRDTLRRQTPRPLPRLSLWAVNPTEANGALAWSEFAARTQLQGVAVQSLLLDAACGGSVLFSRRLRGAPSLVLQPAPGRPFTLLQPDDSGTPARGPCGIFRPAASAHGILLTQVEGGLLYSGTHSPTRNGHGYPSSEVEAVVQRLPFVRGAAVVEEPGDGGGFTLLAFIGSSRERLNVQDLFRLEHLVLRSVLRRIGPEYAPRAVQILPMLPRLAKGGSVDRVWCAQQFLSGALPRRADSPIFALLDRLMVSYQHHILHRLQAPESRAAGAHEGGPR